MAPSGSNVVHLPKIPSLSAGDCSLLVDSVVDYAIFMLDVGGHIMTWNPGAERIKGYLAAEIIGQHFSKFYPAADVEAGKPQRQLDIARAEGRAEDEGWRVRKDGSCFWASVVITALRDESGKLRGFGKVTRDLTARRAAEEQLRAAEERFHLLIDAVTDYAIFMLDPGGCIATWNAGAQRLKGYSPSDIIGRHFSIFYTADDLALGKPDMILESVRLQGRYEDEGWRVRKDGARFWANVVITALRDQAGTLLGFAKVTRDLTARRESEEKDRKLIREQAEREAAQQAERRLRESEERYRALSRRLEIILEGVADGIMVQDRAGRILFANSAAAKIFDFQSTEELMRSSVAELMARFELSDEQGLPFAGEDMPARRVLDEGRDVSSALIHVRERATNRDWWVMLRATAVLEARGERDLAVNVWHDVSLEHREEIQARYLAQATVALGESLVPTEMLANLARVLVPGMATWCSIYLRDGEHVRELTFVQEELARPDLLRVSERTLAPGPSRDTFQGVLQGGVSEVFNELTDETLTKLTSGPLPEALVASRERKAALLVPISVRGRVIGAFLLVAAGRDRGHYDRSDVALVEELGRRAGVALENAQLYGAAQEAAATAARAAKAAETASQAKDEFLATVSHELRTPLNAILGWATILRSQVQDPATLKPIEVIHRNAHAQVKIIDDILDVSRVITGKFRLDSRPADLVAIARGAIEVIRPSAEAKKLTLEFIPEAPYCLLVADPERLQQVIWNLLSNAVKFTGTGGTIRVTVFQSDSQVGLRVSDTGRGIDPGFLPLIFERFKQADSSTTRRVGGLGLGLALVRHIVELHGGVVTAASEGPGTGSTFTIMLPIRAIAPASESPEPPSVELGPARPAVSLSGVRILVVDDEPDARELIATVLGAAGAEVHTAASAFEGFEAVKRLRPDVLVSDIGMPHEDGFSLIRKIRMLPSREGGRMPALALTAFAREEDRTKALNAGFTTHVGKPVNPEALTAVVANLAGLGWRS